MPHVLLTGLSGSGKTTVGPALAARLQRPFIDLDRRIEEQTGRSIRAWFEEDGEAAFRDAEQRVLAELSDEPESVVALGGGATAQIAGLRLAHKLGQVVWLAAPPQRLAKRLSEATDRPLLDGDGAERLRQLHRDRSAHYAHAEHVVWADDAVPNVVENILQRLPDVRRVVSVRSHRHAYSVRVGVLSDADLGASLAAFANRGPMAVVCDSAVRDRAQAVTAEINRLGVRVALCVVQGGERFKRLDAIEALAEWLAANQCDRSSVIVAIGGGSVTDAVGFAASVYMRGVPWVSVPTTMLGVVDSGLGGKVGANLGKGKNLLGAFYPPLAVLADLSWLDSLPPSEVRAGLAEMLKVAATHDAVFFDQLQQLGETRLDAHTLLDYVAKAAALKGDVVSADEFEHGVRKVLNFGHTFGHAFESAAGLGGIRHGEAVALGMLAETEFFVARGEADEETLVRLERAVHGLGLLTDWRPYAAAGAAYVGRDKKRIDDHIQLPVVPRIGSFIWTTATVAEMVHFLMAAVMKEQS